MSSRPQQRRGATAALLGVQAFLAVVVGLALLGVARRHPRRGIGGAGVLTILVAAGLVAVAVAVSQRRGWGRLVGLVLEVLIGVVALSRIGVRPLVAAVNLVLAVAAGLLLAGLDDSGPVGRPTSPGAGEPDPPYPDSAPASP